MKEVQEPIDWKMVELLCMIAIINSLQQDSVTEEFKKLTFKNVLG